MRFENARGEEVVERYCYWDYRYKKKDRKNLTPHDCNAVEGTTCFNLQVENCALCALMFEREE